MKGDGKTMTPEEIAKNKRLQDTQWNKQPIPDKFDMQGIIKYLHEYSGRIPNENECLRFNMFLESFQGKPSERECSDFLQVLGMVKK